MGHSSDWDDIRGRLQESDLDVETDAVDIQEAVDWNGGIKRLASEISMPSILVGYSMGARIALALAIEYPEQVGGLLFVSGNPGLESEKLRNQRLSADLRLADQIEKLADAEALQHFLNQWYQQRVFESLPKALVVEEIRRKASFDYTRWPNLLRTYSVARQPNLWPRIQELSIPFCVVAGQADEKYNNIAMRLGDDAMGRARVQTVADCGHIVHREKPAEFVKIVRNFIANLQ